jgi:hypothetical protein
VVIVYELITYKTLKAAQDFFDNHLRILRSHQNL